MSTAFRVYERPTNGTMGQDCGVFALADLPARYRDKVVGDPTAGEWVLPSLSDGDTGDEPSGLETVIEGGYVNWRGDFTSMGDGGCE